MKYPADSPETPTSQVASSGRIAGTIADQAASTNFAQKIAR